LFSLQKNIVQSQDSSNKGEHLLIFLIGFMGTGKTRWGKTWALQAGYSFVDLDEEIEKEEGASVGDIFAQKGEEYFRQQEAAILRQVAGTGNAIIACGGGTPCFYDNMEWMNEHGTTVLLDAGAPFILGNIQKQPGTRPLLNGMSEQEILTFIEGKLLDRAVFYHKALVTIDAEIAGPNTINDILSFKK
jgi:shikimate kinase